MELIDNVLNKVIEIEDYYGNTILAFMVDNNGNIVKYQNGEIADMDEDYIFDSEKSLIRIQQIEEEEK